MAAPVDYNTRTVYGGLATGHPRGQAPWLSTQNSTVATPTPQQIAHMNRQGMQQGTLYPDQNFHTTIPAERSTPFSKSTSTRLSKGTSLSLMGGMQKVFESGEYSDLTILCEDRKFQVHKVVVCSQSKVLAAAMKKGFKESELSNIDLSADGIPFVSHLVKFLYTGNYDSPALVHTSGINKPSGAPVVSDVENQRLQRRGFQPYVYRACESIMTSHPTRKEINPKEANQNPDYSLHVEMYALSDQYDIPALGALARSKLEATCSAHWNSTSFLEIIPRVYESTLESNQGLRTVVLDHARQHSTDFVKDELLRASFHSVLAATPEFGEALLNEYMTVWPPPAKAKAGICKFCSNVEDAWHDSSWCKTHAGNEQEDAARDPMDEYPTMVLI